MSPDYRYTNTKKNELLKMKRYATVLIIAGLLLASLSFSTPVSAVPSIDKPWARSGQKKKTYTLILS